MAWKKLVGMPKVTRAKHVIDAEGKIVGRLATDVAKLLQGKHKASFVPHIDAGDFVHIVNAAKVKLTGKKLDQKKHYFVSGRPGGIRSVTMRQVASSNKPERILEHAIRYMLPKNKHRVSRLKRLKISV
ncbi:MAG: 50S ribosomal protein L13 [Patescibacteria group bacterium]